MRFLRTAPFLINGKLMSASEVLFANDTSVQLHE